MSKPLVVFHSRSNYTRRVATAIARRLNAEVEEIKIVQPLGGWLGYLMCALEAIAGLTPALRPGRRSLAGFDLIVIGTPVWFWSVSSPVRSWLTTHSVKGHRIAFFCTMGGSGAAGVFATMQQLAGSKPLATLALTDADVDRGADAKVEAFVRGLASGRQPAAARLHARPAHA